MIASEGKGFNTSVKSERRLTFYTDDEITPAVCDTVILWFRAWLLPCLRVFYHSTIPSYSNSITWDFYERIQIINTNKCAIFLKIEAKKVPIWKVVMVEVVSAYFHPPQSWGWNSPCGHATCEHDVTWRPVEADNLNVKPMTTFPLVLTPLLVIAFLKHIFIPSSSPAFFLSTTPEQSCQMAERHVEYVWSEIYCYNKTDTSCLMADGCLFLLFFLLVNAFLELIS